MENLQVQRPTLDSREVAQMVDKDHSKLLRDIRTYMEILGEAKIGLTDYFVESTYIDSQNKTQPCYLLTKIGCEMVANKMTGKKGILFTAKYVKRFNEMQEYIKEKQIDPYKGLSKELQAVFILDKKTQQIEEKVNNMEENMPLFNIECKELQSLVRKTGIEVLGGYRTPAYRDNSLRGKVYADIQGQLKRQFGVNRYEAIKRMQLETAKEILENYKVPLVLESQIQYVNSQLAI